MSSALIGALRVFMGLDSASFHDGLSEAQVAMKKAGEQMQRVGKQMSKVGQTLTTHVTAPITAAFASVAASVVMVSKEVAELAAEAKTAGVSFEAFQQLKYAAERSQVSVEALTDGLKEMQLRADEFAVTGKGSAAEAFERIMEGLMTDREKLDLGFRRDIKTLDDGLAKKVISQQEYDQAVSRARRDYTTNSAGLDAEGLTLPKTPDLSGPFPGVDRINAAWDSMKEADARMREAIFNSREAFADSFAWGAEQAMRGDWKGLLQTVVGDVFSNALKDLGRSLFDMKGGGGFSFGNILSSISKFLPGFKNGGSFTVGGSGGADSKIAMMRVSPRERVDVSTVRQQRRGDGQGLIISVDKSDYFDVAVRRVSAPDAASAGIASFQASESQRQRAVRIAPYRRG